MKTRIIAVPKTSLLVAAVFAGLLLSGFVAWSAYAQKKEAGKVRVTWEYKEVINPQANQANEYGADGWEMVGYAVDANSNRFMCFKRAR